MGIKDIHQYREKAIFPIAALAVQILRKSSKKPFLRSDEIEAVKVHDLVPRRYKVVHKLLLRVRTCVDFSQGAEFGV